MYITHCFASISPDRTGICKMPDLYKAMLKAVTVVQAHTAYVLDGAQRYQHSSDGSNYSGLGFSEPSLRSTLQHLKRTWEH